MSPNLEINDIFEELSDENKRLLNELLFANKCFEVLNAFKTFIDFISNKFKPHLNSNEWQKFEKLRKDIEKVFSEKKTCFERPTEKPALKVVNSDENKWSDHLIGESSQVLLKSNITYLAKRSNTASQNTTSQNTTSQNTTSQNTASQNTASQNTASQNTTSQNTTNQTCNEVTLPSATQTNTQINDNNHNSEVTPTQHIFMDRLEGPLLFQKKSLDSSNSERMSVFKCPFIGCHKWMCFSFIEKHVKQIHNQFVLICKYIDCKNVFQTYQQLALHRSQSHPHSKKGSFKCSQTNCSFVTRLQRNLVLHMRDAHRISLTSSLQDKDKQENKMSCPKEACNQTFDISFFRRHLMTVHKEAAIECRVFECNEKFNNFEDYRNHLATHSSSSAEPKKRVCRRCLLCFDTLTQLREHKTIHRDEVPLYTCPYEGCDYKSENKRLVRVHLTKHLNLDSHKCNTCGKEFRSKSNLKRHIKCMHEFNSRIKCDFMGCHKTLKDKVSLLRHKKCVHQLVDESVKCQYEGCNAVLKNSFVLRIHRIRLHSGQIFTCSWPGCEYKAKNKQGVDLHEVSHSTERKYLCSWPECGKTYKFKLNLDDHLRSHNNDKCFACKWPGCVFRTASSSSLYKHKRIHE